MATLHEKEEKITTAAEASAFYIELNEIIKECEAAKKRMLGIVAEHLDALGTDKDFFECATVGFTHPKEKFSVNETSWELAVSKSLELEQLRKKWEDARSNHLVSVERKSIPYIKARIG